MRAGEPSRSPIELAGRPAMAVLDLDAPDLARRDRVGQQAGQEMAPAAGGLQHARPAPADRPQGLQHRGHQLGRGLEIAKVASHAISPPPPTSLARPELT